MQTAKIKNLDDLKNWVENFLPELTGRDIILLQGAMGVGKSQWVQYLVGFLSEDQSYSPTFAIHNSYEGKSGPIDHLDLYRVEDEEDLESTGFWDLFSQDKATICIEWADRMDRNVYPPGWMIHEIIMEKSEDQQRLLNYSSFPS